MRPLKLHVKIELFSVISNFSANCGAIFKCSTSKNFPKTLVSELVTIMPTDLKLRKLFKFKSVNLSLAHPVL